MMKNEANYDAAVKKQEIAFVSDGYRLAGNLFIPCRPSDRLAYLFIQGWSGHQNLQAAEAVAALGYTTLTYDMRGNGDSEGNFEEFSRADFIKDATVAYDYLRQQVGLAVPIGVVGSSFGGYTAALLSAERDVYCLSLRVPANYPDEGYDEPQLSQITNLDNEWRKEAHDYTQGSALRAVHEFKGSIQVIEAGADEVVASQTPRNYKNAVSDKGLLTYEVMPDAPHRLATDALRADYISRLVAWVRKL